MRRRLPWIVTAAGLALITAGVIIGVTAPSAVSFGWFAYAPLSETMFSPADAVVMSRGVALAWALAALGALLLAFSSGWLLAVRRVRRP